uniref:Uncharacterized protein n=1 Tax=Helianthus annuus TaxID=4232 RepID=A0A251T2B6_HELAN
MSNQRMSCSIMYCQAWRLKPHYMIHHYTHRHEDGGRVMNNKKEWNLVWKAKASICSHFTIHHIEDDDLCLFSSFDYQV